jgi:hypothetical protein
LAAEQPASRRLARRRAAGLVAVARGGRAKAVLRNKAQVRAAHNLALQTQAQLAEQQRQLDEITRQLAASRDIHAAAMARKCGRSPN